MAEDPDAVTAHWMLSRLSVLRAAIEKLAATEGLNEEERAEVVHRSRRAAMQIETALADLVRGHPTLIDLTDSGIHLRGRD